MTSWQIRSPWRGTSAFGEGGDQDLQVAAVPGVDDADAVSVSPGRRRIADPLTVQLPGMVTPDAVDRALPAPGRPGSPPLWDVQVQPASVSCAAGRGRNRHCLLTVIFMSASVPRGPVSAPGQIVRLGAVFVNAVLVPGDGECAQADCDLVRSFFG